MTREIKFRVWHATELAMKYDRYVLDIRGTLYGLAYGDAQFQVAQPFIMQYIGIKDRNDKEIYEGDIIRTYYNYYKNPVDRDMSVGVVVYGQCCAAFMLKQQDDSLSSFHHLIFNYESIGNVLENPELLANKI